VSFYAAEEPEPIEALMLLTHHFRNIERLLPTSTNKNLAMHIGGFQAILSWTND